MKTCRVCGVAKLPSDFHRYHLAPDGLQTRCKPCQLAATAASRKRNGRPREDRACVGCGTTITVRKDQAVRFCWSCAHRHVAAAKVRLREDRPPRRRAFVSGVCVRCGSPFLLIWWAGAGPSGVRFCSGRCRNFGKGKGQSRPDISPAQRRAVFVRDGWICRGCKRRVSKTLQWPHDRCAVVDHVIPLSAGEENGGVHAPHNWQTMHNECNRAKSDAYLQGALL